MGAGQWYKTVKGKPIYFGVLRDPDAALRSYLAWAEGEASKDPSAAKPPPDNELTLQRCLNHYLTARFNDVQAGTLSAGQYVRYCRAVGRILSEFGEDTLVTSLCPGHFERLRRKLTGSPVSVSNAIRDMRSAFKWVLDTYGVRPLFGQSFKRPTARQIREASGRRVLWTAAELRAVLAVAEPHLRAMMLLAINCGFGQTDCALFSRKHFDLEHHNFPRPKTGIARRCPFWPETIAAIACVDRWRPDVEPDLVFITKYGRRFVRDEPIYDNEGDIREIRRQDAVAGMLRRACKAAGVPYKSFYSLRHTFRSVADEVPDVTAIHVIMGHALPGMASVYVQLMANGMARLKVVTDHVHQWLFT
jgi:integrase